MWEKFACSIVHVWILCPLEVATFASSKPNSTPYVFHPDSFAISRKKPVEQPISRMRPSFFIFSIERERLINQVNNRCRITLRASRKIPYLLGWINSLPLVVSGNFNSVCISAFDIT